MRCSSNGTNPLADIHILYRDMQMYGDEKEKMLWDARGMGINFEVYDPEKHPRQVDDGKVIFHQTVLGKTKSCTADLVVLSTPLVAREGSCQSCRTHACSDGQERLFS